MTHLASISNHIIMAKLVDKIELTIVSLTFTTMIDNQSPIKTRLSYKDQTLTTDYVGVFKKRVLYNADFLLENI